MPGKAVAAERYPGYSTILNEESAYGANSLLHADELAYHFLQGNVLDKAAKYGLEAGDRASDLYAWEQATAWYETAVELLEKVEAGPREQAEALERLALALGMHSGKDFLPYSEKALSLYEAIGDRMKVGAVHLQTSSLLSTGSGEEFAQPHALKAVEILEQEGEGAELAGAYIQAGHVAVHGGRQS